MSIKRYISFSGGVESTAMCLLYGKGSTAIWSDTGAEHKEMYVRIDKMEQFFKQYHNGDFELVRLKTTVTHKGVEYTGLENLAIGYKYMPSGQSRYCTRLFKSEIIDKYISDKGECELMIGFNYDECDRVGSLEKMPNVEYTYPLLEEGLTREDCEDILKQNGIHPDFPVYMLRGGCRMCFFKSEKEYKALYHLNPDEFWEVVYFEEKIQDRRKKFYSIMSSTKSLRQLAKECEEEKSFFYNEDFKELYKSYNSGKSCGAFCHR